MRMENASMLTLPFAVSSWAHRKVLETGLLGLKRLRTCRTAIGIVALVGLCVTSVALWLYDIKLGSLLLSVFGLAVLCWYLSVPISVNMPQLEEALPVDGKQIFCRSLWSTRCGYRADFACFLCGLMWSFVSSTRFFCNVTAQSCLTRCSSSTHCKPGNVCLDHTCVPFQNGHIGISLIFLKCSALLGVSTSLALLRLSYGH